MVGYVELNHLVNVCDKLEQKMENPILRFFSICWKNRENPAILDRQLVSAVIQTGNFLST
jgi:hypothetical protein